MEVRCKGRPTPPPGEYIARRVLAVEDDPELAAGFRLKDAEFEAAAAWNGDSRSDA